MGSASFAPLIHGAKRAAIASGAVFLDLNGYAFRPDEGETVHVVRKCAAGDIAEDTFAAWICDFTARKA